MTDRRFGLIPPPPLATLVGDDQLLTLTKTFEPLSESPLHSTSFGVDAPVSVGWGHKSTQFHGSLGKSAAAAAAKLDPLDAPRLLSPHDDRRTRIAWRGDSAWFAVNSVETAPPAPSSSSSPSSSPSSPSERSAEAATRLVRRIRIYSRLGEHSSTSEPLPGLEGSLAWIPSGEILASTQRRLVPVPSAAAATETSDRSTVGSGGEQEEEEEQVQVVFFERNGLRRHDFALRESRARAVTVKEMRWNASSDLLAVWVERADPVAPEQFGHEGDFFSLFSPHNTAIPPFPRLYHTLVTLTCSFRMYGTVQLWHRGNYYWYLKQTISPRLSPARDLIGFEWHPEKAMELELITAGSCFALSAFRRGGWGLGPD